MLPKAHLTSHSRMPGSRWVITPSWLSGSLRSLLYSSFVYSCHLFLISSAFVRFTLFLSFIVPIFAWNVPLVSLIFLKRSVDFPFLLFSSISLLWSLRKAFLSPLVILWNSAFKWVASPTRWTWVWVNSGSWWWTGRPGVLRFLGSQRVGHDWSDLAAAAAAEISSRKLEITRDILCKDGHNKEQKWCGPNRSRRC